MYCALCLLLLCPCVPPLHHCSFDFVFIDNEHGPLTNETIADLSRFAKTIGNTRACTALRLYQHADYVAPRSERVSGVRSLAFVVQAC